MYIIEQHIINNDIVSSLEHILDECVETNNKLIAYNSTCTKGGIQTENLCGYKNVNELINKILNDIRHSELKIKHVHMISYDTGGSQEIHDHKNTESYSFILYLSTCDTGGETVFVDDEKNETKILPEKGNLLFFDSRLMHYAKSTKDKKKVVVVALV